MNKYSIIIGQSGGPTAVINASLQGIIEEAYQHSEIDNIYGALNGIVGIITNQIIDLKKETKETICLLKNTPSSILGSARLQLPLYLEDATIYQHIKDVFERLNIKCFLLIGGNDSMDTCLKISDYFSSINFDCHVIGVPKTIDNDLVGIDHSPGYASSIKYLATIISEMHQDISCYINGKVTIVEIMGRDAGWLTAGTALSSLNNHAPDLIYLPEVAFDINDFLQKVTKIYHQNHCVLVVVSEGIKDANNEYLLQKRTFNNKDDFGHLQLGGVAQVLAEIVNQTLNLPVRSVEINIPQRCASHLASKTDIDEAYNCGKNGLLYAMAGHSGKMVTMIRNKTSKYEICYSLIDLKSVANKIKTVPLDYIDINNSNISQAFIDYALPLIQGEEQINYQNGLPQYAKLIKYYVKSYK